MPHLLHIALLPQLLLVQGKYSNIKKVLAGLAMNSLAGALEKQSTAIEVLAETQIIIDED